MLRVTVPGGDAVPLAMALTELVSASPNKTDLFRRPAETMISVLST